MATAGAQSSTSPRLPSPPPLTEVQIGSPSVGDDSSGQDAEQSLGYSPGNNNDDASATRRVRPGSKAIDMAAGPPLIPLAHLDSPFQLQEHLKALHNHYTRPEGSETVFPIHRNIAIQLAEPPEGVDRALWLYELCRFLTMKVNNLIVAFFAENPSCSIQTCPEMQASEWQYLCAVHDPPKTCCAIDYCCHTLDWATNILTSPKHFPSRLTLGSEASGGPQASMRHLINIFRRVYRIFAHAWFKHREVFWQVEGNEGLYILFKTVCDVYHLMPGDSYTVPAEAEGVELEQVAEKPAEKPAEGPRVTILRKEDGGPKDGDAGATARRHKHSPSTGSRVATIAESAEDNDDSKAELSEVEDATPEEETEGPGEETTIAIEEPQEVTEQPNGDVIIIQEQEVKEEPKPEEPEMTEPKESQQQSTEEQAEPSQPEETQTEPETKPEEESEPFPATEEPSSEPAPEPETKPETETKTETETEEKKEQPAEQDNEPKSETGKGSAKET